MSIENANKILKDFYNFEFGDAIICPPLIQIKEALQIITNEIDLYMSNIKIFKQIKESEKKQDNDNENDDKAFSLPF